ncbi:MAG TPA: CotH kinase family protein [Rhodothermales bacterium]|nr:CotH kinase family protein [Rhodothermales bacterium]
MPLRSLRALALLAGLVAVLPVAAHAQTAGNNVFSGIQVHEIRITFEQPAYWDSLTTYYNEGDEQYLAAAVTLDGVAMDSVGVRFKGNSSYSHPNNKKPLRLSFDEYDDDQRWDGLKGIHLNNNFGDPSFLRERVYLDFCRRAGIPAPRASYAAVYINDTLYGLYNVIEHVDKTFLQTHFGNKNGVMFKAVDAFGATSQYVSDFRSYGTLEAPYYLRYELKSDSTAASWPSLLTVIDAANNSGANLPTALGALVNLDGFYRAMATDHLFSNMDSYSESGRNYYLYFNTATSRMEWIIWDVGLSFGAYGSATPETLSMTRASTTRPLAYNVFNNATMQAAYLQTARGLLDEHFTTESFFPHIDSLVAVIRPYVYADTRKQYTNAQFETNINNDVTTGGGGRRPGIKSFLTARIAYLQAQIPTAGEGAAGPVAAALLRNSPNPFTGATTVEYALPEGGHVVLKVYDTLGREVATLVDEEQTAGTHTARLDGASLGLSGGVYLCRLTTGTTTLVHRVLLDR